MLLFDFIKFCREKGGVIVDDLEIADIDIILSPKRSGELTVMLADFKLLLNDYLKELVSSPVRSLADVIAFNNNHTQLVRTFSILFSQSLLLFSSFFPNKNKVTFSLY